MEGSLNIFANIPLLKSYALSERLWAIVKLGVLFGLLMYMLFTLVIIRAVQLMTRTVSGGLDRQVQIMTWSLFALSAGLFLLALLFL